MFTIALKDPINEAVVQGVLEVLVLHVMVQVIIEARIIDSVYVDMAMSSWKRFLKEGVMPLGVCGMSRVEIL